MFKFLTELTEPQNLRLTETQRMIIAAIINSATPQLAYEACVGAENSMTALYSLNRMGIVAVSQNSCQLTEFGINVAEANDLLDDMGEPTQVSKTLAEKLLAKKIEFLESTKSVLLNFID